MFLLIFVIFAVFLNKCNVQVLLKCLTSIISNMHWMAVLLKPKSAGCFKTTIIHFLCKKSEIRSTVASSHVNRIKNESQDKFLYLRRILDFFVYCRCQHLYKPSFINRPTIKVQMLLSVHFLWKL